jgi:single-stranded-DNA-specific exonuclease
LGVPVSYYIPHRLYEEYGLSLAALQQAAQAGCRLLVAIDCGVSDHAAVAAARAAGMDVIILDHHEPGEELPAGAWVVDPKREDSEYPERQLAAVGVAYKMAQALLQEMGVTLEPLQRDGLELAAIGTVADVVPLRGENRVLAALGLRRLPHTTSPGLRALLDLCALHDEISASDLAFRVGPRLNAVGRVADGTDGLELLLTDDPARARELAFHLEEMNRERRRRQDAVYQEARTQLLERDDLDEQHVLVASSPDWHVGVVGIVASKLQEEFARPAIVLVAEEGALRGSARSMRHFDINEALSRCSPLLTRWGGHALAAGLSLEPARLGEFCALLNEVAAESFGEDLPAAEIQIDAEIELDELDEMVVAELDLLEPCGHSNPGALFMTRAAQVLESRDVGSQSQHLKLFVRQGERAWDCIGFGMGEVAPALSRGDLVDLCFTPEFNDFQGRRSLQLRLEDLRPSDPAGGEEYA